ncbi:uncharacterized protein LOC128546885 [Mercenaria mercenaria]|uniref:uncharacterized protein LOC128546885 n=1 Tax=Mercenaria mercenaria TaxID=6596 RepID=UPI00234F4557|nr:uncharacterized protein LOC128546885 [Mercenaria mercenaria]
MSSIAKILCTPCVREDKNVDAVKYCVECNENFCRSCLRQHIKHFSSVSQHHKLLNRDEMPEWLSAPPKEVENKCTRHPENQLDSYCADHDLVCCGACVVIEHSSCEHVKDLFSIGDEDEPKSEVDVLLKDLQFMIDRLKSLKESRRKDQSNLRKSTAESLQRVRDFRQKVNEIFDKLEKNAVEEIDTECIREDDITESDIKQTEDSIVLLGMASKQIRDSEKQADKPEIESSLNIVNGKKLLKDMKHVCQELQGKRNVQMINFNVNQQIVKYISALTSIGTCKRQSGRKNEPRPKVTSYRVDAEADDAICDIQDVVQTDSGTFLMLDAENKKMKLFDEALNAIKSFDLIGDNKNGTTKQYTYEPFAICCITDNQIAVSMVRDKIINLYNIGDVLETANEIDVGEYCRGLAYSAEKEEIYVACGGGSYTREGLGHIRIYSMNGELLRAIKKAQDGKILSPQPMHLAFNIDESKIFIADNYKGVIAVDTDGKMLSTFTAPELAEARGICVDVNDDVIVCGYVSNNVLRVHGDMKTYDILVTESDGIKNPQALEYMVVSSKCLIASNCMNTVHVFDI